MSTEEKVEMEAVPLKTDTDETKPETTETTLEKKEAPKKSWLFGGSNKKTKVIEEETAEEGKEKPKKSSWWNKGCQKKEKEGDVEGEQKPEMSIGIDMQMRDEKQINNHVNIQFDDVFGEPDSFHSNDCIWRANYRAFEWTRTFFYKVFAIPMFIITIIFGFLFAIVAVANDFFVMPLGKLLSIPFAWISMAWAFIVSTVFNPVANSIGLCFSKINVRKYGINNAPTDLMQA